VKLSECTEFEYKIYLFVICFRCFRETLSLALISGLFFFVRVLFSDQNKLWFEILERILNIIVLHY
jgi:hypothetical protein